MRSLADLNKQGVVSFGEVIVDYISNNKDNTSFKQFIGGATVNVAVRLARKGIPSTYLTKLGDDEDGVFVKEELVNEAVNMNECIMTTTKKVCKVLIHQNENGDRIFHSYQNPTPDEWLLDSEINSHIFIDTKVTYFGSGTLFHEKSRRTTETILELAENFHHIIAFDTNIRLKRWESAELCKRTITAFISRAHIVKMAEDELLFLTNTNSVKEGLAVAVKWAIPYLFVTRGKEGAIALHNQQYISTEGLNVTVVDSTGAGDTFMAAVIETFHDKGLPQSKTDLEELLTYANGVGAKAVTKMGAL